MTAFSRNYEPRNPYSAHAHREVQRKKEERAERHRRQMLFNWEQQMKGDS